MCVLYIAHSCYKIYPHARKRLNFEYNIHYKIPNYIFNFEFILRQLEKKSGTKKKTLRLSIQNTRDIVCKLSICTSAKERPKR